MECQKCKKTLSKKGSHFVCQGACQGTFHRGCVKGLLADMRAGRKRTCCNNCEEESEDESETEELPETNKAIRDILKKVSVLPAVEKQLSTIMQSLSMLSDKYDALLAEHEESKGRINKLEKSAVHMQNKCVHLEKCNAALEQRLDVYEQTNRKHMIEIAGVEQLPRENVQNIVSKLGNEINLSCAEVQSVKRVYPIKEGRKPAPILVEFKPSGVQSREEWLASRRRVAEIKSSDIVGGASSSKIYINESLTSAGRELLWNTKKELRGTYKYIWVNNGKILVKKAEGGNAAWVKTQSDLQDLLKNLKFK